MYINSDVAAELGLQGQLQNVNVSVLNGHIESFETFPITCMIESLDEKTTVSVTALTADMQSYRGAEGICLENMC